MEEALRHSSLSSSTFSLSPLGENFTSPKGKFHLAKITKETREHKGHAHFLTPPFPTFLTLRQISLFRNSQCSPFSKSLAPTLFPSPFRENFTAELRQVAARPTLPSTVCVPVFPSFSFGTTHMANWEKPYGILPFKDCPWVREAAPISYSETVQPRSLLSPHLTSHFRP